jgi:hypothetical protein
VLSDSDIRHVSLSPRKPSALAGAIVTDENKPPPFAASRIRVNPVNADPESVLVTWGAPREQPPRPDWSFRFSNMDGEYLFRVNGLPEGWMLKSVFVGGRDVIDTPLTLTRGAPDIEGLQLVLSRTGAKLGGEVVDRDGAPAPDATVMLFGEDRALWGPGSRFIHVTRPDDSGRFALAGLPPGVYRAIARDVVGEGQWEDPEFLQTLLRDASRVELPASASGTIALTLTTEAR